jgi:hypothetical protein
MSADVDQELARLTPFNAANRSSVVDASASGTASGPEAEADRTTREQSDHRAGGIANKLLIMRRG